MIPREVALRFNETVRLEIHSEDEMYRAGASLLDNKRNRILSEVWLDTETDELMLSGSGIRVSWNMQTETLHSVAISPSVQSSECEVFLYIEADSGGTHVISAVEESEDTWHVLPSGIRLYSDVVTTRAFLAEQSTVQFNTSVVPKNMYVFIEQRIIHNKPEKVLVTWEGDDTTNIVIRLYPPEEVRRLARWLVLPDAESFEEFTDVSDMVRKAWLQTMYPEQCNPPDYIDA